MNLGTFASDLKLNFLLRLILFTYSCCVYVCMYVCIRRCKHLNRLDLLKEEMVLQSFTAETDVLESYTDKAEKLYNSLGTFPVSLDLFIYSLTNLL